MDQWIAVFRRPYYTGRSPGHAVGMAGRGHSKIARVVFVLYVVGHASADFDCDEVLSDP